ncbi:hypothetical protein [Amycolatopsis magusensis]|uniref:hypothetical protein n=1 Tax=Amycolatopsis magusensis TaxID=882444 RepID=UPI003793D411
MVGTSSASRCSAAPDGAVSGVQASSSYAALELDSHPVTTDGSDTLLSRGPATANCTPSRQFSTPPEWKRPSTAPRSGSSAHPHEAALTSLAKMVKGPAPDPYELAQKVESKAAEKFDNWLSEELLCEQFVSAALDRAGAVNCARTLLMTSRRR